MQRYKVFINEQVISFVESLEKSTIVDNLLIIKSPSLISMGVIVEWLLKEDVKTQVYIVDSEPKSRWNEFISLFEIVEAAGGRVKNKKGEVLFIHRLGKWDLPKGKIELGEDQGTAAIREVEEECGISQLSIQEQLSTSYHIYQLKGRLILKPTYWFDMTCDDDSELIPQLEEDIEKAVWVNENDLSEQMANTYESLKEIISNF